MTAIMLPIRCSTVRKLTERLYPIISLELAVALIVGWWWSLSTWVFIQANRYNIFNESCDIHLNTIEVGVMILASFWIIFAPPVFYYVYGKYIPRFECIKDEVTTDES